MWVGSMRSPVCTSANEELGTLAENNPLTGYGPNVIDNYQISETTEIFIQHSPDETLLSSQSLSVGQGRTGRPASDEFASLISNVRENPRRDSDNEQIRILLERQKEQTLADYRAEIQKHEFQADYDRRNIQKLNEVIKSQRSEIYRARQGDEQHRRDQQLLHQQLLEQNRELREAHEKVSLRWKN